jgi:hypothetical protein
MSTMTLHTFNDQPGQDISLPTTARGRALYTVSWFLHGAEPHRNYDHFHSLIKEVSHVDA